MLEDHLLVSMEAFSLDSKTAVPVPCTTKKEVWITVFGTILSRPFFLGVFHSGTTCFPPFLWFQALLEGKPFAVHCCHMLFFSFSGTKN